MGAIGEVFGGLFGTKQGVENVLDKDNGLLVRLGGWVDGFNYTDQEKAEGKALKREWTLRYIDSLAPFKIVQRILAFAATALWIIVGLNILAALWVEALYPHLDIVDPMKEFATSRYVTYPVMICYALYFGGGTIESMKRKKI